MDHQEVSRTKPTRKTRRPVAAKTPPAKSWRERRLYGLAGVNFCLGFIALMLMIRSEFRLAGCVILAAAVFANLEYNYRQADLRPTEQVDELSTLSDFLSFSVVPSILLYRLLFQSWGLVGLGVIFIVLFAGVLRLSLYKIYDPTVGKSGFIGVPLTLTASFIALAAQLLAPGSYSQSFRLGFLAMVTGLAFLNVSTWRYPNPLLRPWVSAALGLAVAAVFWGSPVSLPAVWTLLASGGIFVILGPLGASRIKSGMTNKAKLL